MYSFRSVRATMEWGYEIRQAEAAGKPILCLFDECGDTRLSAMLSGNSSMKVVRYSDLAEAEIAIDEFIADQSV